MSLCSPLDGAAEFGSLWPALMSNSQDFHPSTAIARFPHCKQDSLQPAWAKGWAGCGAALLQHGQATLIRLLLTQPEVQHPGCHSPSSSSLTHKHPRITSQKTQELTWASRREFCGAPPQTGLTPKEIFNIESQVGEQGRAVIWYQVSSHPCTTAKSRLSAMRDDYPMLPDSKGCYRTDNFTF